MDKKEVGLSDVVNWKGERHRRAVDDSFIWKLRARVRIGNPKNLEEFEVLLGKCNRWTYLGQS